MKILVIALLLFPFGWSSYAATNSKYIKTHAIDFQSDSFPSRAMKYLEGRRLVLIGEFHGSAEMPKVAGEIVKALARRAPVLFGIEFPKEYQINIDNFMKTGNTEILRELAFFKNPELASGRSSIAMVKLLENLRKVENVKVFCFDLFYKPGMKSRDTEMAKIVWATIKSHPNAQVVTYSGNIHSRLTEGLPGMPNYAVMGAEILRLSHGRLNFRNSTNVVFRFEHGSFWNCVQDGDKGQPNCGIHIEPSVKTPYSEAVGFSRYFLHEPSIIDGHANSIFLRSVSASAPFQ